MRTPPRARIQRPSIPILPLPPVFPLMELDTNLPTHLRQTLLHSMMENTTLRHPHPPQLLMDTQLSTRVKVTPAMTSLPLLALSRLSSPIIPPILFLSILFKLAKSPLHLLLRPRRNPTVYPLPWNQRVLMELVGSALSTNFDGVRLIDSSRELASCYR